MRVRAPRLWIFLSSLEEAFFSNLLGRYIVFVSSWQLLTQVYPSESFAAHDAPTRPELLSNIEQS
jgi:hypothetical protein